MTEIDALKAAVTRIVTDSNNEVKAVAAKILTIGTAPAPGELQGLADQLNAAAQTTEDQLAILNAPPATLPPTV